MSQQPAGTSSSALVANVDTTLCTFSLGYGHLPPGLELDRNSGQLRGRLITPGTYDAEIVATCGPYTRSSWINLVIEPYPWWTTAAGYVMVAFALVGVLSILWRIVRGKP